MEENNEVIGFRIVLFQIVIKLKQMARIEQSGFRIVLFQIVIKQQ